MTDVTYTLGNEAYGSPEYMCDLADCVWWLHRTEYHLRRYPDSNFSDTYKVTQVGSQYAVKEWHHAHPQMWRTIHVFNTKDALMAWVVLR